MNNEISSMPWPGNKSKAFVNLGDGPLHAYLGLFKHLHYDYLIAVGFKESADMIISHIEEGKGVARHPDNYFFPVAYLYRHGIELTLKYFVILGIQLEILEEDDKIKKLLGEHVLYPLWNKVKIVLSGVWPDGNQTDLKNVERIVQEFHEMDNTGQKFRYSRNGEGKSNFEKMPKSVHLGQLKQTCAELFSFFDGCDAGLSAALDSLNDMRGDMSDYSDR